MGYTAVAGGVTYGVCCADWDVTADSVTHWDEQEREETSLIFTGICAVESRTFSFLYGLKWIVFSHVPEWLKKDIQMLK